MASMPLEKEIEQRFGVLPNFFRLASATPEVTMNLWGFARFAYLDSPLPSLFKERLFVYLSRFCEVRYCIARHVGFLVGLGYPAGDRHCLPQTVEQVLPLLQRSLPRGNELEPAIALCAAYDPESFRFPSADTAEELAFFACATHVFLQTSDAPRVMVALRQMFGTASMESLNVFLAFVRMAHYWTQTHPELRFEDDINQLLATHDALANCLLKEPEVEDNTLSQRVLSELAELRQLKQQHESIVQCEVVSRESEARFRSVFSNNMVPMGIWTVVGDITDANDGLLDLIGYTRLELEAGSIHWIELTPPEYHARDQQAIAEVMADGACTPYEKEFIHKDGHRIPIMSGGGYFGNQNGAGVLFALDLTDRKLAEATLRESEEQLRLFVTASSDIVYKMSADWSEMRHLEGKDFLASTENPSGTWLEQYIPTEDQPQVMVAIQAAIRTKSAFELEHRIIQLDGTVGWTFSRAIPLLNAQHEIVEWLGAASDVTQRKQAELNAEFLATMTQDLIEATCVDEILQTIGEQLNRYLKTSRCAFIEISESAGEAVVQQDWHQEDVPSLVGVYWLPEWVTNQFFQTAKTGKPIVVQDVFTDARIANPQQFAALKIGSFINVPLIRDGEWKFTLGVYHQEGYNWRSDEIELMRELANRIWTMLERARAEAALRVSEEKYRTIFTSMDEGFLLAEVLFDEAGEVLDYRCLEVNPAFYTHTRLPADIVGQTMREIAPSKPIPWLPIYGQVVKTRSAVRFEDDIEMEELRGYYDVHILPLDEPTQHCVAVLFQNITDRKRVEQALQQSEARFRRIFECEMVPMGIWTIAGEIVEANDALLDLLGYTRQELETGQINWQILTLPQYWALDQNALSEIAAQGFSSSYEKVCLHKDGRRIPILVGAASFLDEPNSGVFFVIDLTVRKRTEAQLREAHVQLESALAAGAIYTWQWKIPEDLVIVNAAFAHLFGVDPKMAAVGLPIEVFIQAMHSDDRPRVIAAINQAIKTGEDYAAEYRVYTADGSERWLAARGRVEYDADGKPLAFPGALADITDRKTAEQEREQLLQREQAAREAAENASRIKDEFLAVVSHELRSPLNPILGWSKLLQQGKLDTVRTKAALEIIERNSQLQAQLINDLLDISRILRGKLSLEQVSVDLSIMIASALETVSLAAEAKSLHIETSFPLNIGTVIGDAGRLQQVVWNLLSNAVKFTPPGGRITIALTQSTTSAQIQVTDNGKGINPEFLPYVFEHFRQEDGATTRKFGGLGLGLAIARQIVELHGGTVAVDSPGEGQGATFTVQLPLASVSNQTFSSAVDSVSIDDDLSDIHILVVDDEPDSREFVAFVLELAGALVTSVTSGIEALQAIGQSVPDLIISDIGMPEMDGYMLMQQIRALHQARQIPAIALTAYAGELDRQLARASGFQRHLAKPVEPTEIIAVVAHLCGQKGRC